MSVIYTILCITALGFLFAIVLFVVARKFRVDEDPRIARVEALLPGANCGGCGSAGCHAFAEKAVKSEDLGHCFCPVGGNEVMGKVAAVLGRKVEGQVPKVATIRCAGSNSCRPRTKTYDGVHSCRIAASLSMDEGACRWGCLGYGDCAEVCTMQCITINPQSGLPEVDTDVCGGCGRCVKACPRGVVELRPKGKMVYVSCVSRDKGAATRKACSAGCIGCGKCERSCQAQAIKVVDNVAYIDFNKCTLCRTCVTGCPVKAISAVNFPDAPVTASDDKTKEGE